jgi:SpoVK/Ycf46/Vps4 family AAA+-type ATPase
MRIIVVAATNRPEDCDPALVRRFSIRVVVGLPSLHDRRRIVKRFLKGIESSISKEQLGDIAAATEGWSGSDIRFLTREAAMAPVRDCIQSAALQKHRPRNCSKQTRNNVNIFPESPQMKQRDCQSWMQQEKLLEHFRKLRRVTYEDFVNAIKFWMQNKNPNTPQPDCGRESPASIVLTDCSSDEDD